MSIRAAKSAIKIQSTLEERKEDMNITIGAPVNKSSKNMKLSGLALLGGIGLSVAAIAGAVGFAAQPGTPTPAKMGSTFQAQNTVEDPTYAVRPDLFVSTQPSAPSSEWTAEEMAAIYSVRDEMVVTAQSSALSSEWTAGELAALYAVRFDMSAQASAFSSEWTADELAALYAVRFDMSAQASAFSSEWTADELAAIYPVRFDQSAFVSAEQSSLVEFSLDFGIIPEQTSISLVSPQPSMLSPEWTAHVAADIYAGQADHRSFVYGAPSSLSPEWTAHLAADANGAQTAPSAPASVQQFIVSSEWAAHEEAQVSDNEANRRAFLLGQ